MTAFEIVIPTSRSHHLQNVLVKNVLEVNAVQPFFLIKIFLLHQCIGDSVIRLLIWYSILDCEEKKLPE